MNIFLSLSARAIASLTTTRPIYNNRSQRVAYRNGYIEALADVMNAAQHNATDTSAEARLAAIIEWVENNS